MLRKGDRVIAFIAVLSLAISIGSRLISSSESYREEIVQSITLNLQHELAAIEKESTQLTSTDNWNNLTHSFFLIDSSGVKQWSNNDFVPDLRLLRDSFDIKWINTSRGDFLVDRIRTSDQGELIAVISLTEQFKIV